MERGVDGIMPAKLERCVKKVKKSAWCRSRKCSPYAVCNASIYGKRKSSGQIRHIRKSCKGKVFKAGKKRYVLIKKGKQVKLKTYDPKLFQKVWMRNPRGTVAVKKDGYEITGLRVN